MRSKAPGSKRLTGGACKQKRLRAQNCVHAELMHAEMHGMHAMMHECGNARVQERRHALRDAAAPVRHDDICESAYT